MTLEERMDIIQRKANLDREKEEKAVTEAQKKTELALKNIEKLTERIDTLIVLANKCIREGVSLPSSCVTATFGYGKGYNSYDFSADGIHHHVGFMDFRRDKTKEIKYLGIDEGGCFGVWDFYTNGKETFLKHERTGEIKEPEWKFIQDFLYEFDLFESAFYAWIDSLVDEPEKEKPVVEKTPDISYAVVAYHTFDTETCVYSFDCYEKACAYMEAMWQHCYNEELAERPDNIDEENTYHEENYAQIKWKDGENMARIWQVACVSEPMRIDGKDWR